MSFLLGPGLLPTCELLVLGSVDFDVLPCFHWMLCQWSHKMPKTNTSTSLSFLLFCCWKKTRRPPKEIGSQKKQKKNGIQYIWFAFFAAVLIQFNTTCLGSPEASWTRAIRWGLPRFNQKCCDLQKCESQSTKTKYQLIIISYIAMIYVCYVIFCIISYIIPIPSNHSWTCRPSRRRSGKFPSRKTTDNSGV